MSEKLILELKDVRHAYRSGKNRLEVLKGVNFSLACGEWCCIFGASGSGKTTLLNMIGLLERPEHGKIFIDGVDTASLGSSKRAAFRAAKIGFVFQSYHLLPELNILENVRLAGEIAGLSRREAADRAAELLGRVGLESRLSHRPMELSGGEQQRAAIARALMNRPPLLLADEPTGNLDQTTGAEILDLFKELQQDGVFRTVLMITHNRDIAVNASKVVELENGIRTR